MSHYRHRDYAVIIEGCTRREGLKV
ncbi:paREP8, degenerate [Pyrobaculum aerophilum str. IM2]|uniref:PaREP8, degenerate n=1 Tax=Pyrobaculum aerophilum (strain ATCC 51768 / DSM 7523 / JCM 9630 / CIP 104966 / NBRC 100827 / IM2) TaxID=178306 RepID=Q8ZUF8_PYRAE|nr:paREP8, degenerate [Pyrobaculum aerophilum str. IM2]